jgi:hypothetical protein
MWTLASPSIFKQSQLVEVSKETRVDIWTLGKSLGPSINTSPHVRSNYDSPNNSFA